MIVSFNIEYRTNWGEGAEDVIVEEPIEVQVETLPTMGFGNLEQVKKLELFSTELDVNVIRHKIAVALRLPEEYVDTAAQVLVQYLKDKEKGLV